MLVGALEPISNRATWTVFYELRDNDTDELIDLSGVDEIAIHVREAQSKRSMLTGTKSGGTVEIVDTGLFRWTFTADQMRALPAKTYEVGCTLTDNDETMQLIIGSLPVLDGIVT